MTGSFPIAVFNTTQACGDSEGYAAELSVNNRHSTRRSCWRSNRSAVAEGAKYRYAFDCKTIASLIDIRCHFLGREKGRAHKAPCVMEL